MKDMDPVIKAVLTVKEIPMASTDIAFHLKLSIPLLTSILSSKTKATIE